MPTIAFLLDVDGVISDPVQKKVVEPEIFDHLEEQLAFGNPITLNTGRSNEWIIERVISPLALKLKDKTLLQNLFLVGEKGLTWAAFDTNGNLTQGVFDKNGRVVDKFDLTVFLEKETVNHFITLTNEVKNLINQEYSHSTFFDTTKKAMISTEMMDGYDQPKFADEQQEFTQELHRMMTRLQLSEKFRIDPTTIATDIQIPEAGKHLGTRQILNWLKTYNFQPDHYIAVGDSASDLEMADELISTNTSFDFYYVNPAKELPQNLLGQTANKNKAAIITTHASYGKGLIEVFEKVGR